jgi:hypothetical protein
MRVGPGWTAAACGALAALLLAATPAAAQSPAVTAPSAAYATQLRDTEARLGRAIQQAEGGGAGRTQAGAMPPGQQQLMDATQAAWQAMQNGAPDALRGATGPYADADRTFRRVVETMRVGSTPPDAAVAAAREAQAALGRLREAAAQAGGGTEAAGAPAPSPGTDSRAPLQEPPRR